MSMACLKLNLVMSFPGYSPYVTATTKPSKFSVTCNLFVNDSSEEYTATVSCMVCVVTIFIALKTRLP